MVEVIARIEIAHHDELGQNADDHDQRDREHDAEQKGVKPQGQRRADEGADHV